MAVSNMAWNSNRFFWDGRAELLRHQSLLPIEDELEMDENLDDVIAKLSVESGYVDQFTRAFGDGNITPERISLTLEQFMLSIVSYGSRYDQHLAGESVLNSWNTIPFFLNSAVRIVRIAIPESTSKTMIS